jgi:predicted DNA repair protein MutK
MPASSLLALIDDIATILDDVALLTKVAARKTAGVLGDDLALNAQQALNKLILVPAALAISAFAPWAITPLLMVGGAFLCYEGFEKLAHHFFTSKADALAHQAELLAAVADTKNDLALVEKAKIKGAVRTDFVLSAEIVAITLGTVASSPFPTRALVLSAVAAIMTAGVYGLVAGIVKLDDLGLYLTRRVSGAARAVGATILRLAPVLMKTLSVAGTAAMFLVGGSILTHGLPPVHHLSEGLAARAAGVPAIGALLAWLASPAIDVLTGIATGAAVLGVVILVKRLRRYL